MKTNVRLKKYTVDNRIDKDGDSQPFIALQIDVQFTESIARELATMIDGELIEMSLVPIQQKLEFGAAR